MREDRPSQHVGSRMDVWNWQGDATLLHLMGQQMRVSSPLKAREHEHKSARAQQAHGADEQENHAPSQSRPATVSLGNGECNDSGNENRRSNDEDGRRDICSHFRNADRHDL